MKRVHIVYSALILFVLSYNSPYLFSQCDLELQERIEEEIKNDKVEFLKKFTVELGQRDKVAKYSMVLNEGMWYRIYIYESEKYNGRGHFELLSDTLLLGSNLAKSRIFHYFDFKCKKSQVYNLAIYKDSGDKYCSELVLAYVGEIEKDLCKSKEEKEVDNNVFVVVEKMPVFIEGEASANDFREWMSKELVYPEEAIKQNIKGRVFVQFVVSANGYVKDVKVVRGVNPILDEYAVKLISTSPKWAKPGYQRGVPVDVMYTFPINFEF